MGIGLLLVLAIFFGPPIVVVLVLICQPPEYKSAVRVDRRKYPLTWAVANKNTSVAAHLLDEGLHPDSEYSSQTPLGYAVESGNIAMAELLLSHGADANGHINGEPYLFTAIDTLDAQLAELLLKSGADPNLPDKHGGSALYLIEAGLAYSRYKDADKTAAHEIRELLIKYGAKEQVQ